MMKVNKKVINFKNKSGGVLLRVFCVNVSVFLCFFFFFFVLLALLRTLQSCQSTYSLHKHEQLYTFPVFCSGHNDVYDQNVLHCRLLGLIIYQLSLFSDYLRHCKCFQELDQLIFFCQNYTHYSLKNQSAFLDHTYLWSKTKLTVTMFITYHYLKT